MAQAGGGRYNTGELVMSGNAATQPQDTAERLLQASTVIAVVGMSDNPQRPSYQVAAYLQSQGYRIIPVNPQLTKVLGERCYPDLRSIPEPFDLVDVFRQPQHVPAVVDEAIAVGATALWLQDGVVHETAAAKARAAGMTVVMDDCTARRHRRMQARIQSAQAAAS